MFLDSCVNEAGCYLITFHVNGVKTAVLVDDWVPTLHGKPAFAKGVGGELWVILLEKAWAKLQGTYFRTESGTADMACCHTLGIYSKYYFHKNEEKDAMWDLFAEGERRNFVMIASSKGSGEKLSDLGIVGGHAYALLSVHEFDYEDKTVKLVRLRNPWGHKEWNGAWSDDAPEWTDDIKEKLGWSSEDDGIFYMPFDDYLDNFKASVVTVDYDDDKYKHNRVLTNF